MKQLPRPLQIAKSWIALCLDAGDSAIDATLGNGHDTLFLCQLVGGKGKVIGFDIQKDAVHSTERRLQSSGIPNLTYELHHASHSKLAEMELPEIKAAMFNLGYLPGGDKSIITSAEGSLTALTAVLDALVSGGLVTVMCYPGHEGGDDEAAAVVDFCRKLDRQIWQVQRVDELDQDGRRPFLIGLFRR